MRLRFRIANLPAQVDSAADRTVLPGQVIQALGLVEDGRLHFQGFAGDVVELPVFLVEIHGAHASSSRTIPTAVLGVIANGTPGDIASVKGLRLPA